MWQIYFSVIHVENLSHLWLLSFCGSSHPSCHYTLSLLPSAVSTIRVLLTFHCYFPQVSSLPPHFLIGSLYLLPNSSVSTSASLQTVRDLAARVIFLKQKSDHICPPLKIQWLPVSHWWKIQRFKCDLHGPTRFDLSLLTLSPHPSILLLPFFHQFL